MHAINFPRLKNKSDIAGFSVDVFMLLLIVINMAFITFDWLFGFAFFQKFLAGISPSFYAYYNNSVHPNFLLYDFVFVAIYLLELTVSWTIAVLRKTYDRWYFYPLVHWYDVLGCIPLGTFRWLRILRIFSIIVRLHKVEALDLRQTYLFKKAYKVYQVIMEEISDRVVIKILNGIENEIKQDSPVTTSMVSQVLEPHKETIARWISHRIHQVAEHNYNLHKDDLKNYIEGSISQAVKQNTEVKKINAIPIVGKQITHGLEHGVSNITYEAINGLISGITSEENVKVIEDGISAVLESIVIQEPDKELNHVVKDIFIRAIEMVKEKVKVKRWKDNGVKSAEMAFS